MLLKKLGRSLTLASVLLTAPVAGLVPSQLAAQQAPSAPAESQAESPTQAAAVNYKLSANDLLDFRVFQEPDLDAVVRVAGDETAIFPLVGSLKVGGMTIGEASQLVVARLRDGYLVNPQVSITVRNYARKLFTVLGQVQKPGAYDMQGLDKMSLLEAIGMAGGYTKTADLGSVTVKRIQGNHESIFKFNAKKMAQGKDNATFMIKAGDVITVGESLF
jgi:polysaccharide export outer membrane protein